MHRDPEVEAGYQTVGGRCEAVKNCGSGPDCQAHPSCFGRTAIAWAQDLLSEHLGLLGGPEICTSDNAGKQNQTLFRWSRSTSWKPQMHGQVLR